MNFNLKIILFYVNSIFVKIFRIMSLKDNYFQLKNNKYVYLGQNFYFGNHCRIETINYYRGKAYTPKLIIGNNVHLENRVHIGCLNKVLLGDNILIGSNVLITDHNHGYYDSAHINLHENPLKVAPAYRMLTLDSEVIIERNVWIGENVVVLPNTYIAEGTIIAANSVVKGRLDSFSIYAGNPCKKIKYYNKEKKQWSKNE